MVSDFLYFCTNNLKLNLPHSVIMQFLLFVSVIGLKTGSRDSGHASIGGNNCNDYLPTKFQVRSFIRSKDIER